MMIEPASAQRSAASSWTLGDCILGLDIGERSIGWALVDKKYSRYFNVPTPQSCIRASGSYIFECGTDGFGSKDEASKASVRRRHRGMRRNIRRRRVRRQALRRLLVECGILPPIYLDAAFQPQGKGPENPEARVYESPLLLRARGLDQRLPLLHFGVAILHLSQHRGFKSNRKDRKPDRAMPQSPTNEEEANGSAPVKSKKEGTSRKTGAPRKASRPDPFSTLTRVASSLELMQQSQSRTWGECLARHIRKFPPATSAQRDAAQKRIPVGNQVRRWVPTRELIQAEFDLLWNTQAAYYPAVLTPDVYEKVRQTIFFQLPFYDKEKAHVRRGVCALEPGEFRLSRGHRLYERFSMLQTLNHMRIRPFGEKQAAPLTPQQRGLLLAEIEKGSRKLDHAAVAKLLKLGQAEFSGGDGILLNWIPALDCDATLRKALGADCYSALTEEQKNEVCEACLEEETDEALFARIAAVLAGPLNPQQQELLKRVDLEDGGVGRLSRKALEKLLPAMERGVAYSQAILEVYPTLKGAKSTALQFDRLPFLPGTELGSHSLKSVCENADAYRERRQGYQRELVAEGLLVDDALGWDEIRNPVVKKALNEVRKLVNDLIDTYGGRPAAIHVELAREARGSIKERRERKERNDRLDRARKKYAEELLEHLGVDDARRLHIIPGRRVSREIELRFELYKSMAPVRCIYCGKTGAEQGSGEGLAAIFEDSRYQVDHVAPYSLSFRDARDNLVLSCSACNRAKGNRLPYAAFAETAGYDYDAILRRVQKLNSPYADAILARFQKGYQIDAEESAERHLNDTRYIARQARAYLALLYPESEKKNVRVSSGGVTAALRRAWGLNTLLLKHNKPLDAFLQQRYEEELAGAERLAKENPGAAVKWPRKPSVDLKCRGDRRHHAIDAIVLAVTTPRLVQAHAHFEEARVEARERRAEASTERHMRLPFPWTGFREEVDGVIGTLTVAYDRTNRNRCGLHSEQPKGRHEALVQGKGAKQLMLGASSSAITIRRSNNAPGYVEVGEQHHVVFFRRPKPARKLAGTRSLGAHPVQYEYELLVIHKLVTYRRAKARQPLVCRNFLQNLIDLGIREQELNDVAMKFCEGWEYAGHLEQGELVKLEASRSGSPAEADAPEPTEGEGHIPIRLKEWPGGIWRLNGMSRPVFLLPISTVPEGKSNLKFGGKEFKWFAVCGSLAETKPEQNPLLLRVQQHPFTQFSRIVRVNVDRIGRVKEARRSIHVA